MALGKEKRVADRYRKNGKRDGNAENYYYMKIIYEKMPEVRQNSDTEFSIRIVK
jgi:hypothetical protein